MKNKVKQAVNTAKISTLENFTPLSRKQLQTITGGEDPTTSRGTKTSMPD
jgi:bacteriocin-like protein